MESNKFKRKLTGIVKSKSGQKTVVVSVERKFKHKTYSKFVKSLKNYHAHDEANSCNVGDIVTIIESKPYSKMKKWAIVG